MSDPSGETRTHNQCTYVPVKSRADWVPAAPARKLALLELAAPPLETLQHLVEVGALRRSAVVDAVEHAVKGERSLAARVLAGVPFTEVERFATDLIEAERAQVEEAQKALGAVADRRAKAAAGPAPKLAWNGAEEIAAIAPQAARYLNVSGLLAPIVPTVAELDPAIEAVKRRVDAVARRVRAVRGLNELLRVEPIGFLVLEKLSFTPVDYVRGDLVYSLPLLPREVVRLSHREWARTDSELSRLVATSLETATEDAISEKSELAESLQTQRQHQSAFNASASASAGFGPVSISASVGYSASEASSTAMESSHKRSRELTHSAASRAKQEHKITFSVSNRYETEDASSREITNPTDLPVRFDYHRLLKKWQVDLRRDGMRMTYDLVIPEPGRRLLLPLARLDRLNRELLAPNPFRMAPSSIQPGFYRALESTYQTSLPQPPEPTWLSFRAEKTFQALGGGDDFVEIALPDGFEIDVGATYAVAGSVGHAESAGTIDPLREVNQTQLTNRGGGLTRFSWRYRYRWSGNENDLRGTSVPMTINVRAVPTMSAIQRWQEEAFARLSEAAAAQHEQRLQAIERERDALQAELEKRNDALHLRKLEKEEIMKGALRWLLGPSFSFYPSSLPDAPISDDDTLYERTSDDGAAAEGLLDPELYEAVLQHGELAKFLHEAIEWESVLYVLYPYFWSAPSRWEEKQFLFHADALHRSFLRAGAARVVLTIRPGFERAFTAFVETLELGATLPDSHPYVRIAEELRVAAESDGRDGGEGSREGSVLTWYEYTPTGALDVVDGTGG